jgi:hypothetical protein
MSSFCLLTCIQYLPLLLQILLFLSRGFFAFRKMWACAYRSLKVHVISQDALSRPSVPIQHTYELFKDRSRPGSHGAAHEDEVKQCLLSYLRLNTRLSYTPWLVVDVFESSAAVAACPLNTKPCALTRIIQHNGIIQHTQKTFN